MNCTISPVAFFRSPFSSKFGVPRQSGVVGDLAGEIVFVPEFRRAEALKGIEGFDYLWLIWGFSGNEGRWQMTVRPPRLGGNKSVGVFASRSPFRPNGLGLSSVRLDCVDFDAKDGPVLRVYGADLMDGTPIYDIKPYVAYTDAHADVRSGFADSGDWPESEVVFPEELRVEFLQLVNKANAGFASFDTPDAALRALTGVLAQRPVPQYQHDENRIYGMPFLNCDIHFKVSDNMVIVTDIVPLH